MQAGRMPALSFLPPKPRILSAPEDRLFTYKEAASAREGAIGESI